LSSLSELIDVHTTQYGEVSYHRDSVSIEFLSW